MNSGNAFSFTLNTIFFQAIQHQNNNVAILTKHVEVYTNFNMNII